MNPETKLQNQIIVALCENGCVAWNHTVGQFFTKYGSTVNIGHHGEADIRGHRRSDGRAFYIEVKLPGANPALTRQSSWLLCVTPALCRVALILWSRH